MAVLRMDHVGLVVEDLDAAIEFFTALGMESVSRWNASGEWVGRVIGLSSVDADVAMLRTPDGRSQVELSRFTSPSSPAGAGDQPSNALGIRHLSFAVDDFEGTLARLQSLGAELVGTVEDYEDIYRLCYVRGPAGIIVEVAQPLR